MKLYLFLILIIAINPALAQNRNSIWCFGDSAGIDFNNLSSPAPIHSTLKSRGSCASISDTNGQLLFYSSYDADVYLSGGPPFYNGEVYNRNHNLMVNGDSIVMALWYMENIIVDNPAFINQYYLFSTGVTGNYGLYYSTIDMSLDSGRGAVVQKNVQLLPYAADDGLTCVKHGNGRDWWVIFRKNGAYAGWYDNRFYKYLVSPAGINLVDSQGIGSQDLSGFMRYVFNKTGDKLAMVMYDGLIETFDFDRCTGTFSNHQIIRQLGSSQDALWSCAFSPNGRFLYVSSGWVASTLIQIDLQNPQPWNSCDTLYVENNITYSGGALRLAPDDKIYWTNNWYDGFNFPFPFPDSVFNSYNTNLSVINSPDSLGNASNFTAYSFNLGGGRTYLGLPNNPDYDLPKLTGSICDSLQFAGINEIQLQSDAKLFVFYHSGWQKAFINAQHLKGKKCLMEVFDITGKKIYEVSKQSVLSSYFTFDLDCSAYRSGLYFVRLQTDQEVLTKKFVKN
jgi:hypothetical protein